MEDKIFSVSRINLWDQCSLAWKRKYIEQIPEFDMMEAQIGQAVHKAIELYTEDIMNGNKRNPNSIIGEAVATTNNSTILKEVTDIFETFLLTHYKMNMSTIAGVEQDITKPVDKYMFRGILDLMQIDKTTGVITDYKTSRKIATQTEVDNSLQLSAYALLSFKKYPTLKRFICKLDFVRYGQIVQTERSISDIQGTEHYLKQKMDNITEAVNNNQFDPSPSHYCGWCSYVSMCPIKPKVSTPEELASQVLILEALLKDKRSRLKELVGKYGAISVNSEFFDFIPVTTEIYPPDKVIDVLVEKEVDNPFRFLKVDNKELKYLNPEIYEELFKFVEYRVSTRFGHRREK